MFYNLLSKVLHYQKYPSDKHRILFYDLSLFSPSKNSLYLKWSAHIDFQNFILSLSTTAMYHFGDFPDPTTGETRSNLSAAKQTIDILGMLRDKTEGNLKDAEKQLLEGLLFELRMRYVKEKRTR